MTEKERCWSIDELLPEIAYPGTMIAGFVLFIQLTDSGVDMMIAAYAAALACAGLVTLLEIRLPYREAWRPTASDVANDVSFMAIVQVALPYILAISLVVGLSGLIEAHGIALHGIWPHDMPIWLQVCLMLAAADFPRYWLHRAFHKFPPMWRFHAIHHSPHRLYWVNVGRFHPVEKAIQYCADALPFILLGVAPEVLSAYFVFYAVNGFFQHSNCRVRLGPLNYIISGPELHRWHHSELPKESDQNFGNNLILWDILFGTRFLPRDREVGPLGLVDRTYPTDFFSQMKAPFIRDQGKG